MKKTILVFLLLLAASTSFPQGQKPGDSAVKYYMIKDSTYTITKTDTIACDYVIFQDVIGGAISIKRDCYMILEVKSTLHTELKKENTYELTRVKLFDQWLKAWRVIFYKPKGGQVVFL